MDSTNNNGRKRVSIVWRYFEKLSRTKVRCKLCRREQNYQGTTGNILRHLKSKHRINTNAVQEQTHDTPSKQNVQENLITDNVEEHLDVIEEDNQRYNDEEEHTYAYEDVGKQQNEFIVIKDEGNFSRSGIDKDENEAELDPYTDSNNINDYLVDHEVTTTTTTALPTTTQQPTVDRNRPTLNTVEEERILAEIDYFREKAAYYRMQKNLTALQARKVKHELDQLS